MVWVVVIGAAALLAAAVWWEVKHGLLKPEKDEGKTWGKYDQW